MDVRAASSAQTKPSRVPTSTAFRRTVVARVLGANVLAAGIVYLYGALVSPTTGLEPGPALELTALGIYIAVAAAAGTIVGRRNFAPVAAWLDAERAPSAPELETTLAQPLRQARLVFVGWVGGGAFFAGFHMTPNPYHYDSDYGMFVAGVAVLGGLAAAMLSYLLIEQRFDRSSLSRSSRRLHFVPRRSVSGSGS